MSAHGGQLPKWRRDGGELYFVDGTNRLAAVPVARRGAELTLGEHEVLFEVQPTAGRPYAATDGRRFLAIRPIKSTEPQHIVVVLRGIEAATTK